MKISIVIPAHNEEKLISRCLDSLVNQQTTQDFEVIVVDNNSTDKTKEITEKYKHKLNLRILFENQKGRGRARWRGFKAAQGDVILSTDADAIVPPNWIEGITCCFKEKNIIAVTGSCRINDCSWFVNISFNFFQPTAMILYRVFFGHFWLSGFNFAIRKSAYVKSGGFNPELNTLEDIELSFKVKKIGRIKFVSNLPVIMSGRRFKNGMIMGIISYIITFIQYFLFDRREIDLEDIR